MSSHSDFLLFSFVISPVAPLVSHGSFPPLYLITLFSLTTCLDLFLYFISPLHGIHLFILASPLSSLTSVLTLYNSFLKSRSFFTVYLLLHSISLLTFYLITLSSFLILVCFRPLVSFLTRYSYPSYLLRLLTTHFHLSVFIIPSSHLPHDSSPLSTSLTPHFFSPPSPLISYLLPHLAFHCQASHICVCRLARFTLPPLLSPSLSLSLVLIRTHTLIHSLSNSESHLL